VKTVETTATVEQKRRLILDEDLPVTDRSRVRVIVFLDGEGDIDEKEWRRAAASNPAFEFLKHPEEDIYNLDDGEPFCGEG